jgi:hypothetical protein
MVLTVSFGLSPVTNSFCHRRPRIKGSFKPGRADIASANLTPATGARTTRLLRPQMRCSSTCRMIAHGFFRTHPAIPLHAQRCRVHRIPPRVRDDREPPLVWDETATGIRVIWVNREQIYFCERDSTDPFSGSPSGKSLAMKPAVWTDNTAVALMVLPPLRSIGTEQQTFSRVDSYLEALQAVQPNRGGAAIRSWHRHSIRKTRKRHYPNCRPDQPVGDEERYAAHGDGANQLNCSHAASLLLAARYEGAPLPPPVSPAR